VVHVVAVTHASAVVEAQQQTMANEPMNHHQGHTEIRGMSLPSYLEQSGTSELMC